MGIKSSIIISLFFFFDTSGFCQKSNLIPCQEGQYYCFCDSIGKVVLDKKWEYVSEFAHGFAFVRKKRRAGYIDTTGKFNSDCSFGYVSRFRNGYTWASKKNNEIDIIDTKCNIKFSQKHTWGEHGAALFDSIIVLYALNQMNECQITDSSYGAIDYNFNIVIPFVYANMLKTSSERYYVISKSRGMQIRGDCSLVWGIFDIVNKTEIIPCNYRGNLFGEDNFGYSLKCEDSFFTEMKKLKVSLPPTDEIGEQINRIFNW